jgi:hypothetical protein
LEKRNTREILVKRGGRVSSPREERRNTIEILV